MRIEEDFLGELNIESDAWYGIHTKRAMENFVIEYSRVDLKLIDAMILVKIAAATANLKTKKLSEAKCEAIVSACNELLNGDYRESFPLPAIQGGAGTSINMNVNEVIANIALAKMGHNRGEYQYVHPIEDVNMSQSTNDVFPTAIKIAAINGIRVLVEEIMNLQSVFQEKELEFANILKIGRTQLKDGVPIFLGDQFGAYAEAVSRDRWRLYKSEERLRQINIGGTAIGTGVGATAKYRISVIEELRRLTGIGLARAENLIDNTQNMDLFSEVSGLLKNYAINLSKISNDLRLLDSGPKSAIGEINLPPLQAGSSIMPGKINPVGAEFIKQIYFKVVGNDLTLTLACSEGELELNAWGPIIAETLLENIQILTDATRILAEKVVKDITVNREKCISNLKNSWSTAATLIEQYGYEKLTEIVKESIRTGKDYNDIIAEK